MTDLFESGWADAHGQHVDLPLFKGEQQYRNGWIVGAVRVLADNADAVEVRQFLVGQNADYERFVVVDKLLVLDTQTGRRVKRFDRAYQDLAAMLASELNAEASHGGGPCMARLGLQNDSSGAP